MTNKKSTKLTALLLALVLVTACFIGGTIARYVTSTSSEDEARVAVWGINADDVTMDLFNATYELPDGTVVAQSNDGDNIIAPGTSKDNYFSIVNTDDNLAPEVMYEVRISLDDSEIDPLILNNPSIQWRLDEGAYGTWEETKAQVLALSGHESGVKTYAPGELADEFKAGVTHTIGWTWLMDNNNDEMDTEMGNAAVDGDIVAKIVVNVTARQTDVDSTGMLEGNGSVYDINNPTTLTFRSSAPLSELQSVKVGNDTLTQGTDYTATEGSTVITLKEDYLSTLEKGNYVISIISSNMTAKASFSVEEKTTSNKLAHNGIIPEGGVYYSTVPSYYDENEGMDMYYPTTNSNIQSLITKKYVAGDTFPTPQTGDAYVYDNVEYRYNFKTNTSLYDPFNWVKDETMNGWGIYLISADVNVIIETINGKDVKNADYLYYNKNVSHALSLPDTVTSMIEAYANLTLENTPILPANVKNIEGIFRNSVLPTAPTIPSSVTNLAYALEYAHFSGILTVNATNPQYYESMFSSLELYVDPLNVQVTGSAPENVLKSICEQLDTTMVGFATPGTIIPENAKYYRGITPVYEEEYDEAFYRPGDYSTATSTLTTGDTLPAPQKGDVYVLNGIEYRYGFYDYYEGWAETRWYSANDYNLWNPLNN